MKVEYKFVKHVIINVRHVIMVQETIVLVVIILI